MLFMTKLISRIYNTLRLVSFFFCFFLMAPQGHSETVFTILPDKRKVYTLNPSFLKLPLSYRNIVDYF